MQQKEAESLAGSSQQHCQFILWTEMKLVNFAKKPSAMKNN